MARKATIDIEIGRLDMMLQLIHYENLYLMEKLGGVEVEKCVDKCMEKMDEILSWDPRDGKKDSL